MEELNAPEDPFDVNALRIASPCDMEWSRMKGDARKRFCAACKLNVYNVSELSNAEVQELVQAADGRVCMRLFRRKDGTVITRDCPIGQRIRDRMRTALATVAAVVVGLLGLTSIFGSNIRALFAVSTGALVGDYDQKSEPRRKQATRERLESFGSVPPNAPPVRAFRD